MKLYTLILDRSGSMETIWNTIIPTVNEHIEKKSKNSLSSILLFDTGGLDYIYKYLSQPSFIDKNNFQPRGGTPLRDAIMYAVETLIKDWGDNVVNSEVEFTIFTDGEENSSVAWKSEDVARALTHFQEQYNWKFSFIGCGKQSDIANYAKQFGIKAENSIGYTSEKDLDKAFKAV